MESSLVALKTMYDRSLEYARYLDEGRWISRQEDVSEFWAEIFRERKNYPEFNDMLVMRRGATYPLADRGGNEIRDLGCESYHAQAAYLVVTQSIPERYFSQFEESSFGCPPSFEFNGRTLSAGGITNALTSFRILDWCKSTGLFGRPLRVLEIGAGYGQVAYQLLQQINVESYTICDLPENLFLSSFYLQANFPNKKASFVRDSGSLSDRTAELVFVLPPFLKTLPGPFDLVINSYSFQEMNRTSVEEYFGFVEDRLATNGLFYSLNAHRKAGIAWPSEYPVHKFRLMSVLPVRKYPFQMFATNPYEVVMTKLTGDLASVEAITPFKREFDALGGAFQLGLHEELFDICRKFSKNNTDSKERQWLNELSDFFRASDYTNKRSKLAEMRKLDTLSAVTGYLSGSLDFAFGLNGTAESYLREALHGLTDSQARVRSYVMLACLSYRAGNKREGDSYFCQAKELVPHLTSEISRLLEDHRTLASQVGYQLGWDPTNQNSELRKLYGLVKRKFALVRSWASQLLP